MVSQIWIDMLTKLGGLAALLILIVGAAWKAFQTLCDKWMDSRFAEKLKKIEQQHDVMIRHLQSSIDREFERAVKLHGKEFDVLSEGWSILHEAYWRAREATSRGYQIHDLNQMNTDQLAEFIDNIDFPNWRKQELRNLTEPKQRQGYYVKTWREKQYSSCFERRTDLIMFVDLKAIFMQPVIKAKFLELLNRIDQALSELKCRLQSLDMPNGSPYEFRSSDALRDGETIYKELEALIHERLWSSTFEEQP